MSTLHQANGVSIVNSVVTAINMTVSDSTSSGDGMKILFEHIAPDAIHDSSARFDAPRCNEGTREGVQDDIMTWTYSSVGIDNDATLLLWMQGAAGAGKSAIQQTIAERGASEGILAASFFFSHQDPERDNAGKLVPTLAYQIAVNISDVKPYIAQAVASDVSIFTKSAEVQMEALILDPISRAAQDNPSIVEAWPKLVVIDGLDECNHGYPRPVSPLPMDDDDNGEKHQLSILVLLHNVLTSRRLPFRVVLASRPDQPMRGYLSPEGPAGAVTRRITLDDKYKPDADIRKYLGAAFATIRTRYQLPFNWPSEDVIDTIVDRASGQFIYASTVIRFVGSRSTSRPRENLEFILNTVANVSGTTNPYFTLDDMYTTIFKACPDPMDSILSLKLSLQMVWRRESDVDENRFTAREIDAFLQLDASDAGRMFGGLHSLVSIPGSSEADVKSYDVYHKSLVDFLGQESRCGGELYVSDEAVALKISTQLLRTSGTIWECVSSVPCSNVIHGAKFCTSPMALIQDGHYSYRRFRCPIPWASSSHGWNSQPSVDAHGLKAEFDRVDPNLWAAPRAKARNSELVYLYVWMHGVPFGCQYLKCSDTCRRWRQAIFTQLTLAGVKPPSPFWRWVSAMAPPASPRYMNRYETAWRVRGCFRLNWDLKDDC
ncbi:hypothetical protein FA15DRAFT_760477 [Coprinopsis marcescibilis]|uniref:Nephrocystin 3-like N-terminal domain-containing protein n=1 Tax=Coprinopsis marcescibilis TaxID=230819 RepID=A0A5C3KFC2_COPMA|nr:hypothetical protein FA15DRAFT_760477 [Coprinopsis marcescibilis]